MLDQQQKLCNTKIPSEDDWNYEEQNFEIGDIIEIFDDGWVFGIVLGREDAGLIPVRRLFEENELGIERSNIEEYGTHCFTGQNDPRIGQLVDAFVDNRFVQGTIIGIVGDILSIEPVGNEDGRIFSADKSMIKPYGFVTRGFSNKDNTLRMEFHRSRCVNDEEKASDYNFVHKSRDIRLSSDSKFEHYKKSLRDMGLRLVEIIADGNCLFRAMSHQIYGSEMHHKIVREACMNYIELEEEYFKPFVAGDFKMYMALKRQDGVWGDDLEIQAMCEIYQCAAEVLAYDPVIGAKKLKTFHEADAERDRDTVILSFYGGGHYDSIIDTTSTRRYSDMRPGDVERMRIDELRIHPEYRKADHSNQVPEANIPINSLPLKLDEQLASTTSRSARASKNDVIDASFPESDVASTDFATVEEVLHISENETKKREEDDLDLALQLSQLESNMQTSQEEWEAEEHKLLEQAIRMSQYENLRDTETFGYTFDVSEEEQRAIEESLRKK